MLLQREYECVWILLHLKQTTTTTNQATNPILYMCLFIKSFYRHFLYKDSNAAEKGSIF